MNISDKLIAQFPQFYEKTPVECPQGWYQLIADLTHDIINHMKQCPQCHWSENVRPSQIKDKYGSFRYYMDYGCDYVEDLITSAEDKSEKTCEDCGQKGRTTNIAGWYYTFCPEHMQRTSESLDLRRKEWEGG